MVRGIQVDLTRQRFERFRVVRFWEMTKQGSTWLCRCDCGNTRVVMCGSLSGGNTKSCGCLNIEISAKWCREHAGENSVQYKHGENIGNNRKAQKEFNEKIRKRDNYTCQECNKTQEQELADINRKLSVHHKGGDHFNNVDENAVTLCASCHGPHTRKQRKEQEAQEWLDAAYSVQFGETND